MEEDEKQLLKNAEELTRRIDKSGILYQDYELDVYLNAFTNKLLAQNGHVINKIPCIKVIKHPLLNAFALPNGVVYLHSGILAKIENEAQLAALLGHELTHFTHKHALKEMRNVKNKVTFLNILGTIFVSVGVDFVGDLAALCALASIRGYSRELETEADEEGLKTIIQAGYDPKEGIKLFKHLQQELKDSKIKEPFFFGTHPRLQERIDNYRRLLNTEYVIQAMEEGRLIKEEEYMGRVERLLLDNADLDMKIGRLDTAKSTIEKYLHRRPDGPRAFFLLGDIYQRLGQTQSAIDNYQKASELDPIYAEPHRELGLLYRAQDRKEQSQTEFKKYLALDPKAVDAPIIEGYLLEQVQP